MRLHPLALSLFSLAVSTSALAANPADTSQSAAPPAKPYIRLAQAADSCASDRETMQLMMKNNDRETLRLMLATFQCAEVRAEGEKWLASTASQQPAPQVKPQPPQPPQQPPPQQAQPQPPPQQPYQPPQQPYQPPQQAQPQPPQQPFPPQQPYQPPQQPYQPPQQAQPPQQPYNPNVAGDSIRTARDLGRIASGRFPMRESFMRGDRAKFYRLEYTAPAILELIVNQMQSDLRIVLYDQNGRQIDEQGRKTKYQNQDEYYLSTARPAGVYYVSVENLRGDSTPFDLTIESISPAPPFSHADLAMNLPLGGGRGTATFSFGDQTRYRWAEFRVPRRELYKISLLTRRSDGRTDIDITIYKGAGPRNLSRVAYSDNINDQPEHIVEMLDPNEHYYAEMKRHEGSQADVELIVEPTSEVLDLRLTQGRQIIFREGDWLAFKTRVGNHDRCYAYTVAKEWSPQQQWRGVRPTLHINVQDNDNTIEHVFDEVRYYGPNVRLRAEVHGGSGGDFDIPININGGNVGTFEPCNNDRNKMCVANEGLRGMTLGHRLVVTGQTPDGRTASITYSLIGYQRIIAAITKECRAQTDWLIRKNR